MFYSQFLLTKKAHLGAILLAAYCFRRLKKQQVAETDVASSVDKILVDEVPSVTYRTLAYLLLGVVRIYSKKVEYLFHDCHDIINAMNKYFGKQVISPRTPSKQKRAPQFSIRLPKRFELDTFVVEPADYASGGHIAEDDDIVLQGETWINDVVAEVSLGKKTNLKTVPSRDTQTPQPEGSAAQPSAEATDEQNETCSSSHAPIELSTEQGNGSSIHTPPHDVFSPHQLGNYAEVTSPRNERNLADSNKELRDVRFSREECADFEMFYRANSRDPDNITPSSGHNLDAELDRLTEKLVSECADFDMFHRANIGDPDINFLSYGTNPDVERGHSAEKVVLEGHDALQLKEVASTSRSHDARRLKEMPSTRDGTHGSIVQDAKAAQDGDTPRYLAVRTPANQEGVRVKGSAKRKCIDDRVMVLSNWALKRNIDDASDLVRKRRKAPHTVLDLWRLSYIPDLADNFMKPIIPGLVVGYIESFCRKRLKVMVLAEAGETPSAPEVTLSPTSIKQVEAAVAPSAPEVIISPTSPDGRSAIAPGTPVLYSMPNRLSPGPKTVDSDGEGPMNSYEGARNNVTDEVMSEMDTLETNLMDELSLPTSASSLKEPEENDANGGEPCIWTAKTRAVARYLHRSITHLKQQKRKEAVHLSQLLHSKRRRESARVFYEILVLKSGRFIDLQQKKPYSDILVRETDKMEETLSSY